MRIYTEVIFEWDDKQGKLVETSSESFDYQGEMALCLHHYEWSDWGSLGYDSKGNHYEFRVYDDSGSHDPHYISVTPRGGSRKIITHAIMPPSMAYAHAATYAKDTVGAFVQDESNNTLFSSESEGLEAWAEYSRSQNIDPEQIHRDTGLLYNEETSTWAEGDWDTILTEDNIHDEGTQDWFDYEVANNPDFVENDWEQIDGVWTEKEDEYGDPEGEKAFMETAIQNYAEQWKAIVDPDIYDTFTATIDEATEALKFAAEDVAEAKGDLPGDIADIEEDYTTAKIALGTLEEEGLEETVVGREEELKALRKEVGGETRAAEAKIGAAGFAATGVGRTAREMLAEEIGEAAEDIDVGFTEEREKLKSDYITDVGGLETTRERAGEDVGDPWEDASKTYERLSSGYEGILSSQTQLAQQELGALQVDIFGLISDIRGLEDPEGKSLYGKDYTPFDPDEGILPGRAGEFGWLGDVFETTFPEGLFGEYDEGGVGYDYGGQTYTGQYERFDPTSVEGFELYDPSKVKLPWEPEEGDI